MIIGENSGEMRGERETGDAREDVGRCDVIAMNSVNLTDFVRKRKATDSLYLKKITSPGPADDGSGVTRFPLALRQKSLPQKKVG